MPQVSLSLSWCWTVFCVVFPVASSAYSGDRGPGQFRQGEWPSYGADTANSKYAPLDQIQKDKRHDPLHRLALAFG